MSKKEEEEEEIDYTNNNGLNYIISNNVVMCVDKLQTADVRAGGKLSTGIDIRTGNKIQIHDKDYGISAQLMRSLIEEKEVTSKKTIYIILGIIVFVIIIAGAMFIDNSSNEKTVINKVENDYINSIKTNTQVPKVNTEIQTNIEVPKVNTEIKTIDNNIGVFKNEFELEKLQIEYGHLIAENNNILIENAELKEINNNLEEKLAKYSEKAKNLTSNEFILHLGKMVFDKCEKAENEGVKNNCKDLYFDFVKND